MWAAGKSFQGQSGVSLVELLIVVAIISVVASLAMMQRGSANEQFQRQNVARELKVAFERARFDSVKRRANPSGSPAVPDAYVYVELNQFTLFTDVNQDGDVSDPEDSVLYPFPPNVSVTPRDGLALPATISFNRRGEPSVTDSTFLVCNNTCDFNNDTSANANIVHVTATGTVNMMSGGSTVPTYAAPNVQVIPGSNSIRDDTIIN
jgi:prepilin-type N-terminal cleavage/methylation domain-containing protein